MHRRRISVAAALDAPAGGADNSRGVPARSVVGDHGRRHDFSTCPPAATRRAN
jgi:hypothetical protein